MNYDLAVMALEGLARDPLQIRVLPDGVSIEGSAASMKELARLCLLLAGEPDADDAVELSPGTHVTSVSPALRLKVQM
jgi:hypothetical protein